MSEIVKLQNGGEIEVFDYGYQVVIETRWSREGDEPVIENMELSGRECQVTLRERYS